MNKGKLVVNVGGMYAGKTTKLFQQGERHFRAKRKVVYIKPLTETRFSETHIVSHNGMKVKAIPMSPSQIDAKIGEYDVILIDEIQFFEKKVVEDILALLRAGKIIYASGLDMDFKGEGFETTKELMAIADEVKKMKAVCEICCDDATYSKRVSEDEEVFCLGAKDKYIAVCRECFFKGGNK